MALRGLLGLFYIVQLVLADTEVRFFFALLFLGLMAALLVGDKQRRHGVFLLPGYVVRAVRG